MHRGPRLISFSATESALWAPDSPNVNTETSSCGCLLGPKPSVTLSSKDHSHRCEALVPLRPSSLTNISTSSQYGCSSLAVFVPNSARISMSWNLDSHTISYMFTPLFIPLGICALKCREPVLCPLPRRPVLTCFLSCLLGVMIICVPEGTQQRCKYSQQSAVGSRFQTETQGDRLRAQLQRYLPVPSSQGPESQLGPSLLPYQVSFPGRSLAHFLSRM